MKKNDFAIIGIRLMGIYAIIQSLQQFYGFSFLFDLAGTGNVDGNIIIGLSIIGVGVLQSVVGVYLIKKAESLALIITPKDPEGESIEKLSSEDIQTLLFSVVGLYIFLSSILGVFRYAGTILTSIDSYFPINSFNKQFARGVWLGLLEDLMKSGVGLYLFLRAQTISKWWQMFKVFPRGERNGKN